NHGELEYFFFQAEYGIRVFHVTGVRRVLFRSPALLGGGDPRLPPGAAGGPPEAVRHARAPPEGGGHAVLFRQDHPPPLRRDRGRSEERRVGKRVDHGVRRSI